MGHLSLRSDARQSQTLTPRLQQAVRLLQLSSLDYVRELHETAARNPFLDTEEDNGEAVAEPSPSSPLAPSSADSQWAGDLADRAVAPATDERSPNEPEPERDSVWERDPWTPGAGSRNVDSGDGSASPMEMTAADFGLREHLHGQANVLPLTGRDRTILHALIESLDDDGYLRVGLDDVAQASALEPPPNRCELNTALRLVQSFDPAGVGARSVGECLQLQLAQAEIDDRCLAQRIVADHIERLAQRDVATMARQLNRAVPDVVAACAAIRRLDPHPGWRFGGCDVQYIAPDVIVRKVRGRWSAQLNSAVVPRLRLNRTYADLFRQYREASHGELAAHLQEARWAVRNVEQRFSTILAVAQAIVGRQHLFLDYGSLAMKPLGLKEIADEVGLHESTVCRVTNNKYMATPSGMFELKHFFSRAMPTLSGGACSAVAIRGVIKEMIEAEDPSSPLSDVAVAQRLARQGLSVARRTVTKYRQMLRLAPVERRRVSVLSVSAEAQRA